MKEHDLAKWLEGKMSVQEREAFERTPEFRDYDRIRRYSAELQGPDFDTEVLYQNVIDTPKTKVIPIRKSRPWLRIAAVAVIALGLLFTVNRFTPKTQTAANGTTHIFQLPDDSQVTLNAGSEIRYKRWNWDNNRSLELDGEAYFKVTKGKTFDVHTDWGTVTVVGTQFNVKARGDRFEVACYEGKVRVQTNDRAVLLTPGLSVAFEQGKSVAAIPAQGGPSWMQHQLTFQAESLQAVAAELERQYNIAIDLQQVGSQEKFTGTVPADNLDVALQIISAAYHVQYQKTKNSVTLTKK
ncbi:FecR domain-containing protein [Flavobacterium caeni]|uniref:FecR family protein n=1 Tax=Flavobacterium caeni TaxID=490189 RepID=A0A1G5FSP1_9FLAO|nr:FecR domain-containing protein [Flavobacterium caeni]SCY42263.1 FecR family protein [Flavobacterium caeni]